MRNFLDIAQTAWLYIGLLAVLFVQGYQFYKAHSKKPISNPTLDEIDGYAKAIVAQYDTVSQALMGNQEKKVEATNALINQMSKLGNPMTETVAKGFIEKAVADRRDDEPTTNDDQEQPVEVSVDDGADENDNNSTD